MRVSLFLTIISISLLKTLMWLWLYGNEAVSDAERICMTTRRMLNVPLKSLGTREQAQLMRLLLAAAAVFE